MAIASGINLQKIGAAKTFVVAVSFLFGGIVPDDVIPPPPPFGAQIIVSAEPMRKHPDSFMHGTFLADDVVAEDTPLSAQGVIRLV